MAHLYEYDKKEFYTLLASQELDASKGALFEQGSKMEPDTNHRTILIGLGGTGVKTLDHIKGVIQKRFAPNWTQYVAFLAIDSDATEVGKYLKPSECIYTTKGTILSRIQNPNSYPLAWRPFSDPNVVGVMPSPSSNGAARKRLLGRLKIHDQDSQSAVDMDIVTKLNQIKSTVLAPTAGDSCYEVYVIGSVSGGTCSGAFLEMPALVHKALNVANTHVYAMLYLPDTLTSLDPANASELKANGYASLKELNYYQGLSMRPGYKEKWSCNDPASPEIVIDQSHEYFYTIPYLIGTTSGASADSSQIAREKIAEFFISFLGKVSVADGNPFLTDSFLSNALARKDKKPLTHGATELEAANTSHEFPRHFGSIGFAEAAVPQKLVRSYVVGSACRTAGLRTVSKDDRATMAANGVTLLPFRGEDDMVNATEGTDKAKEILQPLANMLQLVHHAEFSFINDMGWSTEGLWKRIHKHEYDQPMERQKAEKRVEERTGTAAMSELDKIISEAFAKYRANVQEYVRSEGPLAFYNLFVGNFVPVGDNHGLGIAAMLQNLIMVKHMATGVPYNWNDPVQTASYLANALAAVDAADSLLDKISKQQKTANEWMIAYENWRKSQIVKKRREYVFGENGKLQELFALPAAMLADQLRAFGYVLDVLAETYGAHGASLDEFDKFRKASDSKTEVNLAAVSSQAHSWLKSRAAEQAALVNAVKIRQELVDHFFAKGEDGVANSAKWLEVPETLVTRKEGQVRLVTHDVAVPARAIFDGLMKELVPDTLEVSIQSIYEAVKDSGMSYEEFAMNTIQQLNRESQVMLEFVDGQNPAADYNRYIMYPEALRGTEEGQKIAAAIEEAARQVFKGNISVYASGDASTIRLYQMVVPFEIYLLKSLKDWEHNYEASVKALSKDFLHGLSPDVVRNIVPGGYETYTEGMSWYDYPSITRYDTDPKQPDPQTGLICREGEIRIELAKTIAEAKKLGVLYAEQDATDRTWKIYRVNCNKTIEWNLDLSIMTPNALGMLPEGKELALAVAEQNGRTLAQISCPVVLRDAGIFSTGHETEAFAWQYVERTLRAHVPMFIEVRETIEKFRVWGEEIKKFNQNVRERLKPAKMSYMIRARLLSKDNAGMWKLKLENGTEKVIANLPMLQMTSPKDANLIAQGFGAYFLFNKLVKMPELAGDKFDDMYEYARRRLEEYANTNDMDAVKAGMEMAAFINEEIEAMDAAAANLAQAEDPTSFCSERFKNYLTGKSIDVSLAQDLRLFYFRANLWKLL